MLSRLMHILQTPRFLLALSLSTVTAAVVAGPLAVQAVRSDTSVTAYDAAPTVSMDPASVQGVTITAPPAADEVALPEPATETSPPTTTAIAESVVTTSPPATQAPATQQAPTTQPAPSAASTTVITLIRPIETSITSENAPGPVAPTLAEPTTTAVTVETDASTTTVVARPTSTTAPITAVAPTDETAPTNVVTSVAPSSAEDTKPIVTTADPIDAGGSTTTPSQEPSKAEPHDGAGDWLPEIIDIIERSAGVQ